MYTPKMRSRLAVEALGTFWLVFIGCGSAVFNGRFLTQALSDDYPVNYGIGHLGVAIAFGLALLRVDLCVAGRASVCAGAARVAEHGRLAHTAAVG